ncbi:hypothetical protein HK099_000249, partial [Clydaea vesicula]
MAYLTAKPVQFSTNFIRQPTATHNFPIDYNFQELFKRTTAKPQLFPQYQNFSIFNHPVENYLTQLNTNFLYQNCLPSPPENNTNLLPLPISSSPPFPILSEKPTKKKRKLDNEPINVIIKRQKNTEAARRSRSKKAELLGTLETQVKDLESKKSILVVQLAVLENEKEFWISREAELAERVRKLEHNLADSHR